MRVSRHKVQGGSGHEAHGSVWTYKAHVWDRAGGPGCIEIRWRRECDLWIQLEKTGSTGGENAKEFVELLKLRKNGKDT